MFAAALLAASLAAPVPKAKPVELYHPTAEGTKRVLDRTLNGRTTETTETVTKVEEKDGKFTVTVDREMGARTATSVVEVSDKGVFRAGLNGAEAQPMLKLGLKAGDTWTVEQTGPGGGRTTTYTLGKEEEVEVPAGKFKAVPVTTESTAGPQAVKATSWYAAGVGVVKTESDIGGTKQTVVLKSFTTGKAK